MSPPGRIRGFKACRVVLKSCRTIKRSKEEEGKKAEMKSVFGLN
jgi:hypothetical protein